MTATDAARLADLAGRARDAKDALRAAVAASPLRESEIVRATGLARATVRAWCQLGCSPARTGA